MTQRRNRICTGAWALGVSSVLAGCGSPVDGASDCASQIRSEGVVYTSHGFTDQEGSRYAAAEEAACDDVGSDAEGSVFSGDSRSVTTWTFDGYPPVEVLGVRSDADSFAVYVSDSVEPAEREQIYADLANERN